MPWTTLPSMALARPSGIDDLAAIMGDHEPLDPDLAGGAVDVDLGDRGDAGAVALRIGDAAAVDLVAGLVAPRRGPRLPAELLGRRLDDGGVARVLDVLAGGTATGSWSRAAATSSMKDSLAKWICGPTGSRRCERAQRRGAVEQRRDGLPGEALVGEVIGLRRHPEAVARRQRHAEVWPASVSLGLPPLVSTSTRENPLLVNS